MKKIFLIIMGVLLLTGCSLNEDKIVNALENSYYSQDKEEMRVALEDANKYLEDHPDAYDVWLSMGRVYGRIEAYDTAMKCFEKCIELEPDKDGTYISIGTMYRQSGDYELARLAYQNALRILPENPEAYSSLTVLEIVAEDYDQAVIYGEKAWELNDQSAITAANLATAYHYMSMVDKRDEFYQKALDLDYGSIKELEKIFYGQ